MNTESALLSGVFSAWCYMLYSKGTGSNSGFPNLTDFEIFLTGFGLLLLVSRLYVMRYIRRFVPFTIALAFAHRVFWMKSGSASLLQDLTDFINTNMPASTLFVLGDFMVLMIFVSIYNIITGLLDNTGRFSTIKKVVKEIKNFGFSFIKDLPMVVKQVEQSLQELESDLDVEIKSKAREIDGGNVITSLPKRGVAPKTILALMKKETKKENVIWRDGKVSGAVYHGEQEHQDLLNEAFGLYSISNPLHPDIWPSGMKFESEVIRMTASMMDGSAGSSSADAESGYYKFNPNVVGCTSSGGTESIILAIKAHRDFYKEHRGIQHPELIACTSAHAAVDKACDLLGIKLVQVPMNPANGYRMDISATVAGINSNTIMMYSSAPSYPQGAIDDIPTLSRIAQKYSIGLHVDCCLGGFVLPFAKMLRNEKSTFDADDHAENKKTSKINKNVRSNSPKRARSSSSNRTGNSEISRNRSDVLYGENIPDYDFGLPGVTSMSVDTHKFGFALKGTSVVLYANTALRQAQYFCYADWTGGMYTTPTIAGSRSGGLIAQCWASMVAMGEDGYKAHVKDILRTTRTIAQGVQSIEGLRLLGDAAAMIVCFASSDEKKLNTYSVSDMMTRKYGWSLNTLQNPACVHICCTVRHIGREQEFIDDLSSAVQSAQEAIARGDKMEGKAAVYGMASGMPSGPVNELLRAYNDVVLKT